MCALAQGFVEGAARYYCEEVDFRHVSCVEHGAERCLFEISWPNAAAAAA
jgi:predicted hydrocarbon binding protein